MSASSTAQTTSGSAHPGRVTTPPTQTRVAWYAGLGAMAMIGLIEWPVALAVGATHYIQNHSNDKLADQLADGIDAGV